MNTTDDLRDEFAALAANAPAHDAVREEFSRRVARRDKRRRTTGLVAAAAAVVLVAGGIGVTSAMLRSAPSTVGPASVPPVVEVPDVPLPEGTQLIRHQLQPVTSPVTATPPDGLTGTTWIQSPGRLVVAYFDRGAAADMIAAGGAYGESQAKTAGYAITDAQDDPLQTVGQNGLAPADVTQRSITVGGHEATLTTAPPHSTDASGFPATERLSWQLPDGRYIHVWTNGLPTRDSSPSTALMAFAESISETQQTLPRTIGIGLTLPGLTVDSSMNSMPIAGYVAGSVVMCPSEVDPYATSLDQASGSSTSTAPSESSAAPREPGGTDTSEGSVIPAGSPTAPCLSAAVVSAAAAAAPHPGDVDVVSVGGVAVHADTANNQAMADMGNGLVALVQAPDETKLAAGDLAALAASVRLSPSVEVIPFTVPGGQAAGGTASAWSSSSAVASTLATSVSGGASDPDSPQYGNQIDVDGSDDVVATVSPDGATATVEFNVRNYSAESQTLQSLTLAVPGMTQTGLQVRLDNTPADADAEFKDAVLPSMFAPGTRVRIQVEFRVDQCSAAASGQPTLNVEWQAESSGGGFSETLPITDPAGGLKELLSPFCN